MKRSAISIFKIMKLFLIVICFFAFLSNSINAQTINIKCKKSEWYTPHVYPRMKLNDLCYRAPESDDWVCLLGDKCVEWEVTIDHNGLYNDMILAINNNSEKFKEYIIKMLDTVTLQKIYDPNFINN